MLSKRQRLLGGIAAAVAITATAPALAQERPQYGASLDIATANYTLSPLSWDPADWAWKTNQDALYFDQLMAGDLSKSQRNGGKYRFTADSWLPSDAIRGELAESWQQKDDPLRLEIRPRKGVLYPAKPGVMAARELTADEVVFSFNHDQSDWDYRFGWGFFSPIMPGEVVDAGDADWRHGNGNGPCQLVDYVQGNRLMFAKNPADWDKERIAGQACALPFVDKLTPQIIKDESTTLTALRTGKLDIMEIVRWTAADDPKKQAPALKWNRRLATSGVYLSLRSNTQPFDDIRVRRALNMAVNKAEIVAKFYRGKAELFALPQTPDFIGHHEPLDAVPDSVKELYLYNPDKAKQRLTEAGYAKGFSFKVQTCSCAPDLIDLVPMIAADLDRVGVRIEVQQMEYGALCSLMRSGTNAAGMLITNGFGNPNQTLRKNFIKGQHSNTSSWDDKAFEARLASVYTERDETRQQSTVKALSREIIGKAPYIWLPTPYAYTAWWPWVTNYEGELYAGPARAAPI